jgi:hypothetical protein
MNHRRVIHQHIEASGLVCNLLEDLTNALIISVVATHCYALTTCSRHFCGGAVNGAG